MLIDSGDTIIDEGTEVRDGEIVVDGAALPGACEVLKWLYEEKYRIVLNADGYYRSFQNLFLRNGIFEYFYAFTVSELIRARKPDRRMFLAALGAAGLESGEADMALMVGNNLARDIKGANAMGIASVHYQWSPRYPHEPADESECPVYTITSLMQLPEIADEFDRSRGLYRMFTK